MSDNALKIRISEYLQDPTKSVGTEMGLGSFIVLNIATLGLYQLYWAFCNFKQSVLFPKNPGFAAVIYTFFIHISLYSLMDYYDLVAKELGDRSRLPISKLTLAFAFFLLQFVRVFTRHLEEPLKIGIDLACSIGSICILLIIQREINRINSQLRPERATKAFTLTYKHIIGLIAGIISLFAILVAAAILDPRR